MKKLNWFKVHESHEKGMPIPTIAQKLGITQGEVRKGFQKNGLQPVDMNAVFTKIFNEIYNGSKKRLKDVSRETGASIPTLMNRFKKLGLKKQSAIRIVPIQDHIICFEGKRYTADFRGRYRSTTKPQTFLKRDVWELHNGKLLPKQRVYLIDKNESNCTIENLKMKEKK